MRGYPWSKLVSMPSNTEKVNCYFQVQTQHNTQGIILILVVNCFFDGKNLKGQVVAEARGKGDYEIDSPESLRC